MNWRLAAPEMAFSINDSGTTVLVVHNDFAEKLAAFASELTHVKRIVVVGGQLEPYLPRGREPGAAATWRSPASAEVGTFAAWVTVIHHDRELTTQEAADLFRMSRPQLIKLLDQGELAHHRTSDGPGSHRRLLLQNVLAYREK